MRRIALRSLLHERGKLLAALAGVSFAATLALVQTGLYVGFQRSATQVISRVGGDLWVMARGTQLLDFADTLSPSARGAVTAHPCVASARGVVFSWSAIRKPSGGIDNVQLIGAEGLPGRPIPWSMQAGAPEDLRAPMRVALDEADLERLEIPSPAIGRTIELGNREVYVGAVTKGVRSFTVVPYVFAEPRQAQRMLGLSDNQYTFWAVDLKDEACAADVIRTIERHGDLDARPRREFESMTADYWILRSGAGATLAFSALLGLLVGLVVVGQTLFALTEGRLRELATLKTMGASGAELASYVLWQAGFLAAVGSVFGLASAYLMKLGVSLIGLTVVLEPGVIAVGLGSITFMCALASLASVRKVIKLEAARVYRQ